MEENVQIKRVHFCVIVQILVILEIIVNIKVKVMVKFVGKNIAVIMVSIFLNVTFLYLNLFVVDFLVF